MLGRDVEDVRPDELEALARSDIERVQHELVGKDAIDRPCVQIAQLPQSLSDALAVMEKSELVYDALGEHIFEWFLRNKRREWRDYKTHVSQFELRRYLGSL